MTNPSPRPALRKAEDAGVHPAAPRPARAARPPRPASSATEPGAAAGPRTIADTNREANEAAAARAKKNKGKAAPTAGPTAARPKAAGKRHKFSGSTSDHLRVPDTEFLEHPRPKGERKAASKPGATKPGATKPTAGKPAAAGPSAIKPSASKPSAVRAAATDATPRAKAEDLMSGKVVDLGARVPKKLRAAAKAEAKRRGLDLDAVTTELLHEWLHHRD